MSRTRGNGLGESEVSRTRGNGLGESEVSRTRGNGLGESEVNRTRGNGLEESAVNRTRGNGLGESEVNRTRDNGLAESEVNRIHAWFLPRCLVMRWTWGPLPARKCGHKLEHAHNRQGYSLLEGAKRPVQVWEYMPDPILHLMERKLVKNGKGHLTGYLPNYVSFRMALGMVNPLRIDDIWDPDALAYNPRLSKRSSEKNLGGAPVCKAQRGQAASKLQQAVGGCVGGGGRCGSRGGHRPTQGEGADADVHPAETPCNGGKIVRVGRLQRPLRGGNVHVPREMPRPRCSQVWVRGPLHVPRGAMVNHWAEQVPKNTTVVCDSFLSHRTADSVANRKVGYLFLVPKDTKGVPEAGAQLPEGTYRVGHNKRARCSLYAFKAPKVGSKAGRVVPFLTNCDIDAGYVTHGRGLSSLCHLVVDQFAQRHQNSPPGSS